MARPRSSTLRIVFAGTPDFAVPALAALADSGHEIAAVLTQPDRPQGRGLKSAASAVKELALQRALPLLQPPSLKSPDIAARLAAIGADAMVVVAYGLLLPPQILALPRLGCLNIHASLLPRWRGAAPVERSLLAGDEITGVTIMLMDAGLDTGPILLQRSLAVSAEATAGSLRESLARQGADALLEVLDGLAAGTVTPRPQPTDGVSYAPKIHKSEALIDWTGSAQAIEQRVRAFNPWPIAEARLHGEQLRIFRARLAPLPADAPANATPGTVVAVHADALIVACGRGALALLELQRPGRNRVSARELASAMKIAAGERLQ